MGIPFLAMTVEKGHTMITAIRPYTPQNRQRQNFCAVNQKYMKEAGEVAKANIGKLFVIREISEQLDPPDIIDTFKEILKVHPGKFNEHIKNFAEDLNLNSTFPELF